MNENNDFFADDLPGDLEEFGVEMLEDQAGLGLSTAACIYDAVNRWLPLLHNRNPWNSKQLHLIPHRIAGFDRVAALGVPKTSRAAPFPHSNVLLPQSNVLPHSLHRKGVST